MRVTEVAIKLKQIDKNDTNRRRKDCRNDV